MFIRVTVGAGRSLVNPKPFRMVASGLNAWPSPVGTIYRNLDDVALYPEWVPFATRLTEPIATIKAGDEAILTDVFEVTASEALQKPPLFSRVVNRLT